jgi:soluble lytic murein transglycosylase-like protein
VISPVGMADLQARIATLRGQSGTLAAGRLGVDSSASPAGTRTATTLGSASGSASFGSVLESITGGSSLSRNAMAQSIAGGSPFPAATGDVQGVPYSAEFNAAGAKYGVSAKVLAAVAKVESSYHPDAVSGAGAQGMMQLMPSTAAGLGVNPFDPASAVDGAARLLSSLTQRFGSVDQALAAYNIGPGALSRAGGIQPGSQAEKYVNAVRAALEGLA